MPWADPEGEQGVRTPLKNHKSIGFPCNIDPDPLKSQSHQASIQWWAIIDNGVSLMGRWWSIFSGISVLSLPPLKKCSGSAHACSACEPARLKLNCRGHNSCADPESFVRGDPTLTTFFFKVDEGREDPSPTLSGPSSAHQRNAIKWRH